MRTEDADQIARWAADSARRHHKVPLNMSEDERRRLMDVLLRLSELALDTFDVLEANAISEHDVLVIAQIPDYCNSFIEAIEAHCQSHTFNGSE